MKAAIFVIVILSALGGVVWYFYDGTTKPEDIPWPEFQQKTEDVVQFRAGIRDIELSRDEKLLVVASDGIDFLYLPSRNPVNVFARMDDNAGVQRVALTPDRRWLAAAIDRAATDNYRKQLVLFAVEQNKITPHRTVELGHGTSEGLDDLLITPDGAHLIAADAHGALSCYSVPSLEREVRVPGAHRVPTRSWSAVRLTYLARKQLVASCGGDGSVRTWRWNASAKQLERVHETSLGSPVTDIVASADERQLFVSTYKYKDSQLLVLNADTLQTVRRLGKSSNAYTSVSAPRRALEVAVGCRDYVEIFDPRGNDNNGHKPEDSLMGLYGPVGHFSVMNGPSLITDHLYFDGDSRMVTATRHGHLAFYKRLNTEFAKRLWKQLSKPL